MNVAATAVVVPLILAKKTRPVGRRRRLSQAVGFALIAMGLASSSCLVSRRRRSLVPDG